MKNVFLVIFLFLGLNIFSQNQIKTYTGLGIPNFIQLYLNGFCVSQDFKDTTLLFSFNPNQNKGIIYWGYSSPKGYSLEVNPILIYDTNFVLLSTGNEIFDLLDNRYFVEMTLKTKGIDNFCPYFIIINPLAVEFGYVLAHQQKDKIQVIWSTYSEKNSKNFVIQYSYDLSLWFDAFNLPSSYNSSTPKTYYGDFTPPYPGLIYIKIIEYDYNGGRMFSEVVFCNFVLENHFPLHQYDLSGRKIR